MKAVFQIEGSNPQVEVDFNTLIVAGWAGRDMAAIEHHIEELAAIGVRRVPPACRCTTASPTTS